MEQRVDERRANNWLHDMRRPWYDSGEHEARPTTVADLAAEFADVRQDAEVAAYAKGFEDAIEAAKITLYECGAAHELELVSRLRPQPAEKAPETAP